MQILLIEPNQVLANQYANFLRAQKHQIILAKGAQDAITQTDKQTPDVIVLELLLASHSGIEFLYEFRSYSEWQNVPVIIISRVPEREVANSTEVLKKLGVTDYLYKPETSLRRLADRIAALAPARV